MGDFEPRLDKRYQAIAENDLRAGKLVGEDRGALLSQSARQVLDRARQKGAEYGWLGKEHMLLAIVEQEDGAAALILERLGIVPSKVKSAVEFAIGKKDSVRLQDIPMPSHAPYLGAALRFGDDFIGTHHMLHDLADTSRNSIASGILESFGVTQEKIRTESPRAVADVKAAGDFWT